MATTKDIAKYIKFLIYENNYVTNQIRRSLSSDFIPTNENIDSILESSSMKDKKIIRKNIQRLFEVNEEYRVTDLFILEIIISV